MADRQAKKPRVEQSPQRARSNSSAGVPKNLATMLRSDETTYGTLIQSPSPFWVAWGGSLIAREIDFVFIDTEHTPIQRHDLSAMCMMYRGVGLPALVRVTDAEQARQALDGGAAGVVLPYVETVEEVKALRGAVKMRPLKGARMRDAVDSGAYESKELAEYVTKGGDQRALVINIESSVAIENLESLLASEHGVDAVLIGPHDLSCSLGVPEQYNHPKFVEAVKTIFRTARKHGVGAAIHHIGELFGPGMQNSDAATMVREWQCNNIIASGDLAFFVHGLRSAVRQIKNLAGEVPSVTPDSDAIGTSA